MPFYFKYMLKSGMYQDFNVLFLGSWFLVLGSWFLVLGFWCLVFGAWFLVLGYQNRNYKNHKNY